MAMSSERTSAWVLPIELDWGARLAGIANPGRFAPTQRWAELLDRICVDGFVTTATAGSTYFPGYFKVIDRGDLGGPSVATSL
jgi:hypothetical protein